MTHEAMWSLAAASVAIIGLCGGGKAVCRGSLKRRGR